MKNQGFQLFFCVICRQLKRGRKSPFCPVIGKTLEVGLPTLFSHMIRICSIHIIPFLLADMDEKKVDDKSEK